MSDPRDNHDPIDEAYVRAEAMLDDDAARAARRARVLAAVAAEPAETRARGPVWRRGGWLAAASLTGVVVLLATQVYLPALHPTAASSPAAHAPAARVTLNPPASSDDARSSSPTSRKVAAAAPRLMIVPRPPPVTISPASPPPDSVVSPTLAPAPPPPPPSAPAPRFLAHAPPPPAPIAAPPPASAAADTTVGEVVVVTAQKRTANALARPAPSAFPEIGGRLRAAALAGRTDEIKALLAAGALVDAPDEQGDTALMMAVLADHPAAAALLRRHGAKLDLKNNAGQSARDMAAPVSDAALDRALGTAP